jgi:enterochelin esterase-like enzyme
MLASSSLLTFSLLLAQTTARREPFTELPLPPAPELQAQLQKDGSLAVKGEEMTFVFKFKADKVDLTGGIQKPMKKVEGTDDLWAIKLSVPRLDEAVIRWDFFVQNEGVVPELKVGDVFRGSKAEPPLEDRKELKGKLHPFELESKALGEKRKFKVYIPPTSSGPTFAIYAADGACEGVAAFLEPLMESGKIPPTAVVGVDNGGYRGDRAKPYDEKLDLRAKEYLRVVDPDRFDKHLAFFADEVVPFVESKFNIGKNRMNRAVLGWSNGGVFAAETGLRKGDVFGLAIPLSMGVMPEVDGRPKNLPQFYLSSGTLEPGFFRQTSLFSKQLMDWKATLKFNDRVAGHDFELWKSETVKAIAWYFEKPNPLVKS